LVIFPPETVSSTWTGPHWVDATEPVTVFVPLLVPAEPLLEEEDEDEPLDVPPPEVPEEVPAEPVVPDTIEVGALAVVVALEASYPKRRTTTDRVLRSQNVMRFMGSPREGLEMEPVLGEAGGGQGGADQVGPVLGAADVDVAVGDVGDPVQEGGQVVDRPHAVAEPRVRAAAMSRERQHPEPLLERE
jgi:hypothetical protein